MDQQKVYELQSVLMDLVRVGKVTATNDDEMTARVQFDDRDGIVSHKLRVVVKNSARNKDYYMPDIGEQVLCLFLPIGIEQGYILGSFYSRVTKPDTQTKEKRKTTFEDGTVVEYDRSTHTLVANLGQSNVEIDRTKAFVESNGSTVTIDGGKIQLESNSNSVLIDATGVHLSGGGNTVSVTAAGISMGGSNVGSTTMNIGSSGTAIEGDIVQTSGNITTTGDVEAGNVSLTEHTHPGDSGGTTGPPNA